MLPFEMRTVLNGICLFINTHKIVRQHFISKGNRGEESKIAERQRERERVRVRQCMGEKER
jgi:hypothetical protein